MPAAPDSARRPPPVSPQVSPQVSPNVLWSIVEESGDEAEFLWQRRDAMLDAPDRSLSDVETWAEERLLGALDGLTVAGDPGVERVLGPMLASEEASRVSAAALALLSSGSANAVGVFGEAFVTASGARLAALRRALELVPAALPSLERPAQSASPEVTAAYFDACAFARRPLDGQAVASHLAGREVELQRAAARGLRFTPTAVQQACYPIFLRLADPQARSLAVESYVVAGFPKARTECRSECRMLAGAEICGSARMLLLLAMVGTASDHKVVVKALRKEGRQRDALWALGFGGRLEGAEACIDMLARERHVRLAAEAFCAITGLDLDAQGLVVPPAPEPDEPVPFEEDDLDANLEPQPEDALPMPDVGGVVAWWSQHRARFEPGVRYLAGRPADMDGLHALLVRGPMRRRHAWALEMAVRSQGRLQVETRALVPEQRRQLAAFAQTPRSSMQDPER
jgi:uncharacterized protein (TIGR02270 family)